MKVPFLFLSLIFSVQAFSCDVYEAQFIGKVRSVEKTETGECLIGLEQSFRHYAVNQLCPLYQEELLESGVKVSSCGYMKGDTISGVAVWSGEFEFPYLDN